MKKLIAIVIGLLLVLSFSTKTNINKNRLPFRANEEVISEVISEETSSETVSSEIEEITDIEVPSDVVDTAKSFWENDVLPFVASISFGSLVSICFSFLFAMKNKNTISEVSETSKQVVEIAKGIVDKTQIATTKVIELIQQQNETMKDNKVQNEKILNVMTDFKSTMDECKNDLDKMDAVKKSTDNLIVVHSKMANNTKELVANGTAEEINKIVEDNHLKEGE